ncbi:MAG TPA: hypothetical protein VIA64_06655 [Burkholderiales bacterium]|jgi:hypothetical protein
MHAAAPSPEAERVLCERFRRSIPERVNADRHLVWRGRTLSVDCLVQIGSTAFLLRIDRGSIRECRMELPLLCSWDLAVRGTLQAWIALWQDPPPPGWHDLFALSKRREISLEGNLQPLFAHLQYFKDLLALPRDGGG